VNDPRPLYLVTVVHNRRAVSEVFARNLAAQNVPGLTLVLVDDGSTDGTAEAVVAAYPNTVVLMGDGNLWWAGGLQKGLNWLAAQGLAPQTNVIFMNDDVEFKAGFFDQALTELNRLPLGQFLVVPGVFWPSGRRGEEAVVCDWPRFRFRHFGNHPERIDCATTRSLFMRWQDLRRVGGFRPLTLPHYVSDYEFTIRARRKGILLVPSRTAIAEYNDLTTGNHRTAGLSLAKKIRLMLSPRFSFNPITMFLFVWHSAPLVWKVPCWARIAVSTLRFLK